MVYVVSFKTSGGSAFPLVIGNRVWDSIDKRNLPRLNGNNVTYDDYVEFPKMEIRLAEIINRGNTEYLKILEETIEIPDYLKEGGWHLAQLEGLFLGRDQPTKKELDEIRRDFNNDNVDVILNRAKGHLSPIQAFEDYKTFVYVFRRNEDGDVELFDMNIPDNPQTDEYITEIFSHVYAVGQFSIPVKERIYEPIKKKYNLPRFSQMNTKLDTISLVTAERDRHNLLIQRNQWTDEFGEFPNNSPPRYHGYTAPDLIII